MKLLQIMSDSRQIAAACPASPLTGAAPQLATAIHDATVTSVEVSSPASHLATRRSHAPSSTPSRTPARIAARSACGTNPPGSDSSGTAGTAALTGPAPHAGNPA
jgi:hypothetical protein